MISTFHIRAITKAVNRGGPKIIRAHESTLSIKNHQSLNDIKHKISSSITTKNFNYRNIKREDMQLMIANLLMSIMTNGGILDKKEEEDAVKYIFKVGLSTMVMDNITTFTLGSCS